MTGLGGGRPSSSVPAVERERLVEHVAALAGERHPRSSPGAHREAADYIEEAFRELGYDPERHPFRFHGRTHENVVARKQGGDPARPRVLVGAHFDTVRGTPGADDNASGVALLLEAARVFRTDALDAGVDLVAFDLEEFQGWTYRVGSRRHVARARTEGVRYEAAYILEMVGYTDSRPGSQRIPPMLGWMGFPDTGDFIAAIGDGKSARLLSRFREAAGRVEPELPVVTFRSPLRGWLVWNTRRSDNASFWSAGIPALMLTDTSFLRNPHYHRSSDRPETLDFDFLRAVTAATVEAVRDVAGVGAAGEG